MRSLNLFVTLVISLLGCKFVQFEITKSSRLMGMPQPDHTVYIPPGTFKNDNNQQISISGFYMFDTEITNLQYKKFLQESESTKHLEPSDSVILSIWVSDSMNYFENPWFDDFPVVGLTKGQMKAYANWLSKETKREYPQWDFNFRLPSKDEWQYAAKGGMDQDFPWGSYYTNSKGCYLMHFFNREYHSKVYPKEVRINKNLVSDIPDSLQILEHEKLRECTRNFKKKYGNCCGNLPFLGMPVSVFSYLPNNYGLYHMSGNVAELTEDGTILGGSFRTSSEFCKIQDTKPYPFDASEPQQDVGFRLVATYREAKYVE